MDPSAVKQSREPTPYTHSITTSGADRRNFFRSREIYDWFDAEQQGYVADGHPIVYVANGSHASFPEVGDGNSVEPCAEWWHPGFTINRSLPANDHVADGGVYWRTWEGSLDSIEDEPWYGYGGAWGHAGTFS